MLDIAVL